MVEVLKVTKIEPNWKIEESTDQSTKENEDHMRTLRINWRKLILRHCFVQGCVAFLSVILGIMTIYFALANPKFPYIFGGPLIAGTPVLIATGVGSLVMRKSAFSEGVTYKNKCVMHLFFAACVYGVLFSILCGSFSAWGIANCYSNETTSLGERLEDFCLPNKIGNVAMAITDIVISVVMLIWSFVGAYLYIKYSKSFGIEDRKLTPEQMKKIQDNYWDPF